MKRLVLGTAGHIDHGKTALVAALTGIDTDRLKEEKSRGITIELGFAELQAGEDVHFGVVDVPGHEAFVKTMVAGATGLDVVLLVVAADEGVMPQTREHLAIVRLLEAPRLVVALTKADLVDEEWLELVRDEVGELLADGPFADAPLVPVAALEGRGLDDLREALAAAGRMAADRSRSDLVRLPVDRVFTVRGTGTVVTGTLWSGTLESGDRFRILPRKLDGRVRGLQVHGAEVHEAGPGDRTAVALTGSEMTTDDVARGSTLVTHPTWPPSPMLTVHLEVLPDTAWQITHRQRVRVHLGTAEVLARVALLGRDFMDGGESGWAQLRLEEPLVARTGDRFVVRSYSPMTTIAGGAVVEPLPPRRRSVDATQGRAWDIIRSADPAPVLGAVLELHGWGGAPVALLPVLTGLSPEALSRAADERPGDLEADGHRVGERYVRDGGRTLLDAVDEAHRDFPHRPGIPVDQLRALLPPPRGRALTDILLGQLQESGKLTVEQGIVARAEFRPALNAEQDRLRARILELLDDQGLAPAARADLPALLDTDAEPVEELLALMRSSGDVVPVDEQFFLTSASAEALRSSVLRELGGRSGLGPADFRDVIPVTRKHLMPLLSYLDLTGVTLRAPDGTRSVGGQ
jgi:selenocysteine-specific elongation factor